MINIFGNQTLGEKTVAMETPNSYSSQIFKVLHGLLLLLVQMNLKWVTNIFQSLLEKSFFSRQ